MYTVISPAVHSLASCSSVSPRTHIQAAQKTADSARAAAADDESEEAEEARRQEAIRWSEYKDYNRRGDGNKYNRG